MYTRFSIINIIFFIYILNNQISNSYGVGYLLSNTYENIDDYINSYEGIQSSVNIQIYDKNRTLNKTEVLNLKNHHYIGYYCKNDICVEVNINHLPEYIEIPDEKGNIKSYISKSYTYEYLKLGGYYDIVTLGFDDSFSCECTSNSQCLTNKCIDRLCIFNDENPIEFCTDIYINLAMFSYSYIYCGKTIGDTCKKNKEYESKNCRKDNICGLPPSGPYEGSFIIGFFKFNIFVYYYYYN